MRNSFILAPLISLFFVPAMSACAVARPAPSLPPDQASLVDATCSQVMGFGRGDWTYVQCSEALTDSLLRKLASNVKLRSHEDCENSGLEEGTREYATCVLDKRKAYSAEEVEKISAAQQNSVAPVTLKPYAVNARGKPKGYFDVPSREQTDIENYACAQLGLNPGSSLFMQCTTQLDLGITVSP